jgi:hypothetical protein
MLIFTISPTTVCAGGPVTVNYNGNIPPVLLMYTFNWDWNGALFIEHRSWSLYRYWDTAGTKTISLTIGADVPVHHQLQKYNRYPTGFYMVDTTICQGMSYAGYTLQALIQIPLQPLVIVIVSAYCIYRCKLFDALLGQYSLILQRRFHSIRPG